MRPVLPASGERMGDQEQRGLPVSQQPHVATKEESRWRTAKQPAASKSSQGVRPGTGSGKVLWVCLVMAIVDIYASFFTVNSFRFPSGTVTIMANLVHLDHWLFGLGLTLAEFCSKQLCKIGLI